MAPRLSPWQVLGLSHEASVADVRRAYAALIKQYRPDSHPEEFARIREAYETALPAARRREAQIEAQRDAARQAAPEHGFARADENDGAEPDDGTLTRDESPAGGEDVLHAPPQREPGREPLIADPAQVDTARPALSPPRPPVRVNTDAPVLDARPVDPLESPVRIDTASPSFDAAPPAPVRIAIEPPVLDAPPHPDPARVDTSHPDLAPDRSPPPSAPPVRVLGSSPFMSPSPQPKPVRIEARPPEASAPPRPPAPKPPRVRPRPQPAEAATRGEPALAERVAVVRKRRSDAGEDAALPWLRTLLRRSNRASIDDRQALEIALLEWFLQDEDPPLLLMFDAGRAFGWHRQESRLAPWLPAGADRRLELLLTMSRDLVFARHGSRGTVRRLFTPGMPVPPFAFTIAQIEARGWEQRWLALQAAAGAPALQSRLNQRARRALGGGVLLSTDLFLGALVALACSGAAVDLLVDATGSPSLHRIPDWLATCVTAVLVAIVIALLRRAAVHGLRLFAQSPRLAPLRRLVARARAQRGVSVGVVLLSIFLVAVIADAFRSEMLLWAGFGLLAGVFAVIVLGWLLRFAWLLAFQVERVAHGLTAWRESVDRWEFERLLAQPIQVGAQADGSVPRRPPPPFGARAGLRARLMAIKAARRHEQAEIQRRERPPRVEPAFRLTPVKTPARAKPAPSGWRQYWWLIWIVIAIGRLLAGLH